ncbi:MAG: hypothetical protein AAGA56_14530 [Myxococcota bacterium]
MGVLASRSKPKNLDRAEVVPEPPPHEVDPLQLQAELELELEEEPRPRRKSWAWLLRHVFLKEVSVCPRCDGPTTWLEVATEPDAIGRAMADHGLLPRPPPPVPLSRPPPREQLRLPL